MKEHDSTDRLLRRSRHALERQPPPGACLDAETIAAWTSGALPPGRRAAAEAHAADCDRCLGIVAALARTEPLPQARPWMSWLRAGWLVPATAAATALFVWILAERPAERPHLSTPESERAAARIEASPPPVVEPQPPVPPAARQGPADSRSDQSRSRDAAFGAAPSEAPAAKSFRSEAPRVAAPAAAAEERQQPAQELNGLAESVAAAPPPPDDPAVAAEGVRVLRGTAPTAMDTAAVTDTPTEILSPNPAVRWRIAGTSIERSADGGQTWRRQEPLAPARLLAGSSPAPSVCWVAGASGTILRTTDGDTWTRVPFPEAADLVAITSTGAQTAAVKTADGRTFHTADGGRTWALQETPVAPF